MNIQNHGLPKRRRLIFLNNWPLICILAGILHFSGSLQHMLLAGSKMIYLSAGKCCRVANISTTKFSKPKMQQSQSNLKAI